MKDNVFCNGSFISKCIIGFLILVTSSSVYAYRTEADCEEFEGKGQCCKASDGTYHRNAACGYLTAALKGDLPAHNNWVMTLAKEYEKYEAKFQRISSETKPTIGSNTEKIYLGLLKKADEDVAWSKNQLSNAKVNQNKAIALANEKNEFNVAINKNWLAFKSISDYEKIVNLPSDDIKNKFLKTINSFTDFTAFEKKQNFTKNLNVANEKLINLIEDEYFRNILNSDLMVQIGTNIFRINPSTEKVYVLAVENENQYKDLISENITNKNIRTFSTDDDVLELIQNSNRLKICKESGIGGSYKTTGIINVDPAGVNKMEGKLHFNKFGIYYSLFAEVSTFTSGIVELSIELQPVFYKKKCDSSAGPYNQWYGKGSKFKYKKYQSYQGSKNLNKVYFRVKFHGAIDTPTGPFVRSSNWIEIRVNY